MITVGVNTLFMVPGDVGGTETYLRKTLQAIAAGFPDVVIKLFTSQSNDEVLRGDLHGYPQVHYECLRFRAASRPKRIVAEQTLLPWKVRRASVDVLWSPGYTAPLCCSCPQVVTIHDLQYKSHPDDMSFLERVTLDFLVRGSCRRTSGVITVSEFSRDEVVRYGFAPPARIYPVVLGVDESFGVAVGNPSLIPTTKPYLLCVAHTYPHKNVHMLVKAYGKIQKHIPHDLILVGTARRGENLVEESMAFVKDQSRVHRLGALDHPTLRYLYQQADLFVLPSLYEGFGLPVLEAMMAGTLVVTSKNASIPEVASDHAFYCDPHDEDSLGEAICRALSLGDAQKLKRIHNAKHWSAGYSWNKTARETIRVLRSVVDVE